MISKHLAALRRASLGREVLAHGIEGDGDNYDWYCCGHREGYNQAVADMLIEVEPLLKALSLIDAANDLINILSDDYCESPIANALEQAVIDAEEALDAWKQKMEAK